MIKRKDNFKVFQYDVRCQCLYLCPQAANLFQVTVTPLPKVANSICKKVWNSPRIQEALKATGAKMWLYDNNKLAWLVLRPPSNSLYTAMLNWVFQVHYLGAWRGGSGED